MWHKAKKHPTEWSAYQNNYFDYTTLERGGQ